MVGPGIAFRRKPGDVVILLYHRVGQDGGEIGLSIEEFQRQMRLLGDQEHLITLDEIAAGVPEGGVAISFDDGYRDFYEHALPALVENGVPATLYLATSLVSQGNGNREGIGWSQLEEAVAGGLVTIGSHTHGHADLSKATEQEAEREMQRSKDLIEDHLGVACRHFSYPWAIGSQPADRAARRLFDSAALDAWRTNRRGKIDPHRLGRVPILRSDGLWLFRAKTQGLLNGEALYYRAFRRGPWRHR